MTKRRDRGGLSPVRSAGTALGVLATFFLTACDSSDVQETQQLEAATSEQDHPNIVVVIADQMRAHAMGAMGNRQIITPNLDALAAEGILISNAISGQPVCTPFRAQLMTGRYSHSTGVIHNDIRLPDDAVIFPQLLQQQGYTTGYIGKWHLSGDRENPVDAVSRRGWDYWAVRNVSHSHDQTRYWLNDATEPVAAEGWEPDVQTDLAIEFIKANSQRPFGLFLSFGPPHNPYDLVPRQYIDMYEGSSLTGRPNVPIGNEETLRLYYAAITSLDANIGRLTDALAEAGVAENTIFVFTADHGDMLGSQGHRLKQRPWEESINIPFILRYPEKIDPGQEHDWLVTTVDMMPTVLGLSDIAVPDEVEGLDLSALFEGTSREERQAAFLFNVHRGGGPGTDWRGIRTKEWVFARQYAGDWVMYDLENDPYELRNLIDDEDYAGRKQALRQQLTALRMALGESIPLVGIDPDPVELPTGRE
jgi:arylsulfatase A-like enzyme